MNTARQEMLAQYGEARKAAEVRQDERDELFHLICGRTTLKAVERILASGYTRAEPIGYIIVDSETHKLDWDGELHKTYEDAIESLCGPYQMYVRTPEEAASSEGDKTYWAEHYTISPVVAG